MNVVSSPSVMAKCSVSYLFASANALRNSGYCLYRVITVLPLPDGPICAQMTLQRCTFKSVPPVVLGLDKAVLSRWCKPEAYLLQTLVQHLNFQTWRNHKALTNAVIC
jgi:hypothetical protein